ncbi:MAG: nucleotidyltransferase family protein [Deltaproteobacteria bacterium]|nr:nucleotidyltransferase family protein [Deltaproteobacteria bacterium]
MKSGGPADDELVELAHQCTSMLERGDFGVTLCRVLQPEAAARLPTPVPILDRLATRLWQAQRRALVELGQWFDDDGITAIVLKGSDHIERYCGSQPLGTHADIDVLVGRQALGMARRRLYSQGYVQAVYDPEGHTWVDYDGLEAMRIEATHYELLPFVRVERQELTTDDVEALRDLPPRTHRMLEHRGIHISGDTVVLQVCIDLHHGLFKDDDPGPLFERAVDSPFAKSMLGLGPTDDLWICLHREYLNVASRARTSPKGLFYCAKLAGAPGVDWDQLIERATARDMPGLYYWLSFINALADQQPVPAEALAHLRELKRNSRCDWGWQLERVLGVESSVSWLLDPPWPSGREPHRSHGP